MNYRYIKALGLSNDNISLAYDVTYYEEGRCGVDGKL